MDACLKDSHLDTRTKVCILINVIVRRASMSSVSTLLQAVCPQAEGGSYNQVKLHIHPLAAKKNTKEQILTHPCLHLVSRVPNGGARSLRVSASGTFRGEDVAVFRTEGVVGGFRWGGGEEGGREEGLGADGLPH